jgi:hypothetical protein
MRRALLLLLAAEDSPLAVLLLEVGQDVRRRHVDDVLGLSRSADTSLP